MRSFRAVESMGPLHGFPHAVKDLQPVKGIRDAQRKWIEFRDANCGFYYDPEGGSAARLASQECVVTLTAERAYELETLKSK